MKRINKLFLLFILIISIGIVSIKADSGWDADYDSGFSSSYSSDYSSSYSGSSNYSDGSHSIADVIVIIIFLIIFLPTILKSINNNKNHNDSNLDLEEISIDELKEIDPNLDLEDLRQDVINIYKAIQNAWMDFDYETLKKYTTDELYNTYESDLKVLSLKQQKNIMKEIKATNIKIINVKIENDIEVVSAYLTIQMYDYVVNNKNEVIRGTKNQKMEISYIITLTKNFKNITKKCPKCGADIADISNGTCTYCRYKIVNNMSNFVMSKKQNIKQRRL